MLSERDAGLAIQAHQKEHQLGNLAQNRQGRNTDNENDDTWTKWPWISNTETKE